MGRSPPEPQLTNRGKTLQRYPASYRLRNIAGDGRGKPLGWIHATVGGTVWAIDGHEVHDDAAYKLEIRLGGQCFSASLILGKTDH